MDVKELKAAFNENQKQIDKLTSLYKQRYNTKSNQTIYTFIVLSLKAELQNILIALKFNKLDYAIEKVKKITLKYSQLAFDCNENIVGTLQTFIGAIEYLFINAVKIEYNYYVKKEQASEEQIVIREQMKQEKEERKAIENEQKKIEIEEGKYQAEIKKVADAMQNAKE